MHSARSTLRPVLGALLVAHAAACAPESASTTRAAAATASAESANTESASTAAAQPAAIADQPIETWRTELLELAFEAASAMPMNPHVKNRSRAQEEVVAACFELDQPRRALGYADRIENWLRGSGHAEFAAYCAERGAAAEAREHIDVALAVARASDHATGQAWRKDQILAKVARAELLLGRVAEADRLTQGIEASEAGPVAQMRARTLAPEQFDEHLRALEAPIATGELALVQGALGACAELHDRFYEDRTRRDALEQRIRSSWGKLPLLVRFQIMLRLTESALGHADAQHALALVEETEAIVASATWPAEDQVALTARLAGLRQRAGDPQGARERADRALALFEAERARIVDVFRAGALRPLAETYHVLGDRDAAISAYRRTVEDGALNPNSRPRAQDLVATACSMALAGVEPEPELWQRLRAIRAALGEPW